MTIKTRLIASTAALLCLGTVVIGIVAIGAVTSTMTDRVDEQLREFLRQPPASQTAVMPTQPNSGATSPAYQPVAVLAADVNGTITNALPAGYSTDRLELPRLPSPLPEAGQISTVPARDGSVDYRLLVGGEMTFLDRAGNRLSQSLVLAAPLSEVSAVRTMLVSTMLATVTVILALSIGGSWLITRMGLRPVDDMVDTAAAIADGDLERRAKVSGRPNELGRLATSLNTMVSKLVHAIGEREAEQVRLRRFVADASHELRTPLATVGGYAELYESGGAPPGPMLDRAMGRIRAENHRMTRLIDDLLLLARLDEEADLQRQPVDLRQLAIDGADDARVIDADRVLHVEAPEPVTVVGDDSRLRQVLGNLLTNVRQHTDADTEITITVAIEAERAVLSVSDTGPGIAPEHRAKVFDRLYRADPSRSRATGGSGLGLAIVESIVTKHGGTVGLDSELGEGTTVRIELPLA